MFIFVYNVGGYPPVYFCGRYKAVNNPTKQSVRDDIQPSLERDMYWIYHKADATEFTEREIEQLRIHYASDRYVVQLVKPMIRQLLIDFSEV